MLLLFFTSAAAVILVIGRWPALLRSPPTNRIVIYSAELLSETSHSIESFVLSSRRIKLVKIYTR